MSKTLGQVAFEAYRDEIRKDKTLWCDDWADLPEHAYSHWQAAAEAVVTHYDGPAHSRKSKCLRRQKAEKDIVDAAVRDFHAGAGSDETVWMHTAAFLALDSEEE